MPRIPRSDRTVRRNRLNTGRVMNTMSNEQFGYGQSAQRVDQQRARRDQQLIQTASLANTFKTELNRTEGMRAANGFDLERGQLQSEYLNKERGKNAAQNFGKYKTKLDELKSKYSQTLNNEEQKEFYTSYATRSERSFYEKAKAHSMTETRNYTKQVREERYKLNVSDAISSHGVAGRVQEKLSLIDSELEGEYKIEGHSDEWLANKKNEARSEIHGGVIGKLVSEQRAVEAKQWLEQNKGDLDEETYNKSLKIVDAVYKVEEHQGITDAFIASGVSEKEALATVRKNRKGKDEEALVSMVKRRYSERDRSNKVDKNGMLMDLVAEIEKGVHFDELPVTEFQALDKNNQKLLLRVYEKYQKGGDIKTNPLIMADMREMLLNPETRDKAIRDGALEQNIDAFSTEDYIQMKRFETFVANNDQEKLKSYQTKKQVFDTKIQQAELKLAENDYKMLREKYYLELDKLQQSTGRRAEPEDEQEIFNTLTMEVITDKDNAEWLQFGDDKKMVFELTADDFELGDLEGDLESIVENDLIRKGVINDLSPIDDRDEAIQKALAENYKYYSDQINKSDSGRTGGF